METLQTALFENPLGIYIALAIVGLLGLISYKSFRTLKSAWPAWGALAAGAAVFAVSTLVVTDREKIQIACDEIVQAVNDRDMVALEQFIDEDFSGMEYLSGTREGLTRKEALRRLNRDLEEVKVTKVTLTILDLKVDDKRANMLVQSDIASKTIPFVRLKWRVEWIGRSATWRVARVAGPIVGPDTADDGTSP